MTHASAAPRPLDQRVVTVLDELREHVAAKVLEHCCASSKWVTLMLAAHPYESSDTLEAHIDRAFDRLDRDDWLQAFSAHARIGAPKDDAGSAEQAAVSSASAEQLAALQQANDRYEQRFGHVFLIRAAGRSTAEMIDAIRERTANSAADELRNASAQQREITRLRLNALAAERDQADHAHADRDAA